MKYLKKNRGKYKKQKSSQKNNDNMFDSLEKLNKLRLDEESLKKNLNK